MYVGLKVKTCALCGSCLVAVTLSPQAVKRVRNRQQSIGKDGRKRVHCYLCMESGWNDAVPAGAVYPTTNTATIYMFLASTKWSSLAQLFIPRQKQGSSWQSLARMYMFLFRLSFCPWVGATHPIPTPPPRSCKSNSNGWQIRPQTQQQRTMFSAVSMLTSACLLHVIIEARALPGKSFHPPLHPPALKQNRRHSWQIQSRTQQQ